MVVRLQSNQIPGSVFSAAFKNEALLRAKAETGKVRLFMMASIESTIVMRMYLLSFVRVAQMNHYLFECAPGTESQCVEWDWFYQYLTQFGKKRMIFGDFKGYDRSMHPIFILKAFDVIARFIIFCTGDLAHANAVRCIGMEIAFTRLDFFGDLVRLFGKNPSGQALTAIINGLVNSLYMRYVYVVCAPERNCLQFKSHVALITYGDDNGMGVSAKIDFFTHTSIRDVLETIGVVYTMADKTRRVAPSSTLLTVVS
jgi:hypothetical protein